MMKIAIINGPNLNLLGTREPSIYGVETFESYYKKIQEAYSDVEFVYYQSNVEGELINYLQDVSAICDGVVINPGGYSHTSVALADCISAISTKVVEVHISNIHARETFRQQSITGSKVSVVITGAGLAGYELAVRYLTNRVVL